MNKTQFMLAEFSWNVIFLYYNFRIKYLFIYIKYILILKLKKNVKYRFYRDIQIYIGIYKLLFLSKTRR